MLCVDNSDHFSCETAYTVVEEQVYSEECTVYLEEHCRPQVEEVVYPPAPRVLNPHIQPEPYPYQNRNKRDVQVGPTPAYHTHGSEVNAHPRCQPVPRQSCHQIPRVVPRKVPHEVCHPVPTSHCGFILKTVPEVECGPFPVEECKDVAKSVPYIVAQEECEQVVYDECQEVANNGIDF